MHTRMGNQRDRSNFNGRIPCQKKENPGKRNEMHHRRVGNDPSGILPGVIIFMVVMCKFIDQKITV